MFNRMTMCKIEQVYDNTRIVLYKVHSLFKVYHVNDPSAGSPTETLLRLLLPLNEQV